jgi:hypothetical protein
VRHQRTTGSGSEKYPWACPFLMIDSQADAKTSQQASPG